MNYINAIFDNWLFIAIPIIVLVGYWKFRSSKSRCERGRHDWEIMSVLPYDDMHHFNVKCKCCGLIHRFNGYDESCID